ncbi:MAG: glutamine synthetase type III, partial [Acidaminococcaceae bacterium]|nr:glutamine synthetase type III [Acidaminococcaceae bacterium]
YTTVNLACDDNQLTMEYMKRIALKHNMVCLLHEKPFDGVNGSGKHNNWSLSTLEGKNLLDPGDDIYHNNQFLLFLAAIIKGVDEYQDVLRGTVASAGNDHRLGANEAPPAIVSIFLGTELTGVLEAIAAGKEYKTHGSIQMKLSGNTIAAVSKDNTDRNRTSPFAFTGNKFEVRMVGSQASLACTNTYLNTIVTEELEWVADKLEGTAPADLDKAIKELVKEIYLEHKRIIFNGNGYTDEWVEEAKKRGLSNNKSTPEALACMGTKKNVDLVVKHGIFTKTEVLSRCEIQYELYNKTLNIEALTMLDMLHKDLLPAAEKYLKDLSTAALNTKALGMKPDVVFLKKLQEATAVMYRDGEALAKELAKAEKIADQKKAGTVYHEKVLAAMETLRHSGDAVEALLGQDYLPYPTYGELLFGINN